MLVSQHHFVADGLDVGAGFESVAFLLSLDLSFFFVSEVSDFSEEVDPSPLDLRA